MVIGEHEYEGNGNPSNPTDVSRKLFPHLEKVSELTNTRGIIVIPLFKVFKLKGFDMTSKRMSVEERKAQIMKIAYDLFSEVGYRGLTTRELAKRCGITEPIIYRHFEDGKCELFIALAEVELKEKNVTHFTLQLIASRKLDVEFEKLVRRMMRIHGGKKKLASKLADAIF